MDMTSQLEKLKELKEKGVLTQKEFNEQKKKLLDQGLETKSFSISELLNKMKLLTSKKMSRRFILASVVLLGVFCGIGIYINMNNYAGKKECESIAEYSSERCKCIYKIAKENNIEDTKKFFSFISSTYKMKDEDENAAAMFVLGSLFNASNPDNEKYFKTMDIAENQCDATKGFYEHEWWKTATPKSVSDALKDKADVNKRVDGWNALEKACRYNSDLNVIKLLVKAGADINSKDSDNQTILMIASQYASNPDIIEYLIDNGADVNAVDDDGYTALIGALTYNSTPKVAEVLIKNRANVNVKNNLWDTPLMIATAKNVDLSIVKKLVEKGADINAQTQEGLSALLIASKMSDNPKLIGLLIKNGANLKQTTTAGADALLLASSNNKNPEIVKTLLKHGADINARQSEGWNALMMASSDNDNPEVIKALVKAGCNINDSDNMDKLTPLMVACGYNKNPKIVETLIELGANVNAKDYEGKTAKDYADENPNIKSSGIYTKLTELSEPDETDKDSPRIGSVIELN